MTQGWQHICEAEVARVWSLSPPDGAHDRGHLRRVWANCRRIALGEGGADMLVLEPAAFLHDIVNPPKTSPDRTRASRLSADHAAAFLAASGYPPDRIPAVAHAIAAHSFSAGIAPETPEARILQDADRIEALGAIGLARMFHVAGATGRALFHDTDPLARHRRPDEGRFALDHVETKLLRLPDLMQTATGRRLAVERAEVIRAFRAMLADEIGAG